MKEEVGVFDVAMVNQFISEATESAKSLKYYHSNGSNFMDRS